LKLALVLPDLSHKGGAESVVAWTAAGLSRRGHEVALVTGGARPELWPDLPELEGLVRIVEPDTHGRRVERHLRTGRAIAPLLRSFPLVYAHNRYGLLWSLEAAGRLCWYCQEPSRRLHAPSTDAFLIRALARDDVDPAHPALVQMKSILRRQTRNPKRRLRTWRRRRRDRNWAARPERVFVNSAFSAGVFERALHRRPEVLDLGVPETRPEEPGRGGGGIAVVASGSVKKNLFGVLQAARELERRRALPGRVFHVWGIGTDGAQFRTLVEAWDLSGRVVLHGFREDAWARPRLAASDLCLFLPLCEPFGLVPVEALLAGVPILVSDHGGPAGILARCGGGRAVDPLRPDRIADALEAMLGTEEVRTAGREEARRAGERAREIFSMARYLERTETLLGLAARESGAAAR